MPMVATTMSVFHGNVSAESSTVSLSNSTTAMAPSARATATQRAREKIIADKPTLPTIGDHAMTDRR